MCLSLPAVYLAADWMSAWHPPVLLTRLLLNLCHPLITQFVNVSPWSSPCILVSMLQLCQQFSSPSLLFLQLPDHHHLPPCAFSFPRLWADDYSNKKHLRLQITTMIKTPVLLLQLSVVVYGAFVPEFYLSLSSPFLSVSHMMTPLWPSDVLSLVVWWPSRENPATIV